MLFPFGLLRLIERKEFFMKSIYIITLFLNVGATSCSVADAVKFPSPVIDRGLDTNVGDKSSGVLRVPEVGRSSVSKSYASTIDEKRITTERNYKEQAPLRDYRQNKNDFSYNASCQFGFCNQTGTPQLFQQRNE